MSMSRFEKFTERATGKPIWVEAATISAVVEHEETSRIIGEPPTKFASLMTPSGVLAVTENAADVVARLEGN